MRNAQEFCAVFGLASSYVHTWLLKQPSVKEESLTDWMLFDIAEKSLKVRYQLFSRHNEGRFTGADWEWWFVSNSRSLRLRIQAKKAQGAKDMYPDIARKNKFGLQIDKLLTDARAQNAIPLYAFFSSEKGDTQCPLNKVTEGVYLASAAKVHASFVATARKKITAKDVLAISNPLSCIACCPLSGSSEPPIEYLKRYFPEEFIQDDPRNLAVGIHEQIPWYVHELLAHDRTAPYENPKAVEISVTSKALLVIDMRY